MRRCAFVLLSLLMILTVPGAVGAAETIGSVKTVQGEASIVRGGETLTAQEGLKLNEGDLLETGPDGSLGVLFRDDSSISLGPGSRLEINSFVFAPEEGRMGFITRMIKGTAAYLSGKIGKLSPESVHFETPVATIGIRGTRMVVKVEEE